MAGGRGQEEEWRWWVSGRRRGCGIAAGVPAVQFLRLCEARGEPSRRLPAIDPDEHKLPCSLARKHEHAGAATAYSASASENFQRSVVP